MLNLMMSKNNLSNNNLSNNGFYSTSENHSLQNSPTTTNTSQPVTVDKSVWDMYQLLMQSATSQSSANTCQQNESTSTTTLDQILLAATSKLSPPPHTQQNSTSVSPILVVINNNSHNTSLNHPNPMINLVNTCITPSKSHNMSGNNSSPSHFDNQHQFNMSSADNQIFNFHQQHVTTNNQTNLNDSLTPSPPLQKLSSTPPLHARGIQKSHKMAKLTQHVSSTCLHSSPTTSSELASSSSSSTPLTPQQQFNSSLSTGNVVIKSEGKFSRPLLKNETVLCEKPKFKQNYFVFEKKKEKAQISFHNISVNEIISGEIQSGSGNSPKLNNQKKNKKVSNNGMGNKQMKQQFGVFAQQPIQVFQQHIPSQSMQSLDSSSASNQSSPMLTIPQMQLTQHVPQQFIQSNIRMTHSPNTSNSSNNSNGQLDQQPMTITHQLLTQQAIIPSVTTQTASTTRSSPPIENNSNVLNILLSNVNNNQQFVGNKYLELSCLNNNEYTPISSFSNTNNSMMNCSHQDTNINPVDNLLASLSPVVESLFPQHLQQQQSITTNNEAAANNNASFMNAEVLPSSSFLPLEDFIVEEDLSNFVFDNSSAVATTATMASASTSVPLQELSQEQWSDLLEQYIAMMNKNNNNN
ncbi:predicted protein [Naegleria gruberi]|uniref:Predicted protein n=1 Tax=Naegleria gruberi TaxID=5762 RepID=D2VAF6_NAEGR|nr:uncharacterized protein NAEGRDRAFT_47954 [Naegleria gruberi]EFC46420.1 predicted protein [Naegleria gruberi]|eukprot:XP_002679164.1 predicted protein [Naegleria gruberi strain NEG-M]